MSANPIWIAGYFGPIAGAAPVWIAPGDGTVPSAVQSEIVSFFSPVAGATAVWIAGFFAPPPAAIGATPITISGWGGSGGSGPPPVTSVWSAADATANSMTLSNGGLTVTPTGNAVWGSVRGTTSKSVGKLYVEFLGTGTIASGPTTVALMMGLASASFDATSYLGNSTYSGALMPNYNGSYVSTGFTDNYNVNSNFAANDVWALAVDFTTGGVWIARNNVWLNSSNPATGSLPALSFIQATVGALFPALSFNNIGVGVWTLQPTAASQKYAPPSGFSAWDSAAPSHSPQALAYLARTVGGNEGGNGANIATLIDGLVSDGVWAKLDALYVLAQQNATDALLNLVGTSYSLSVFAVPVFTAYVGYSSFSLGALDTGFNAAYAPSPHYTANNASYGVWSYAVVTENYAVMGNGAIEGNASIMYPHFTDNNFYPRLNDNSGGSVPSPGSKGLFVGDRPSSVNVFPYWNGAQQAGLASTSAGVVNATFTIGQAQGYLERDNPTPRVGTAQTISAAFIGASLGAAGQLALYNRLRTYMTAVGVP